MNPAEKQWQQVEKIFGMVNEEYVTPQEVEAIFSAIIEAINKTKRELEQNMAHNKGEMTNGVAGLHQILKESEGRLGRLITSHKDLNREELNKVVKQFYAEVKRVEDLIPAPAVFSHLEAKIAEVEKKIPVKTNLKPLENDIENIKEDIKEMREEISELKKKSKGGTQVNAGIVGRDLIKDIDLSSQLNGSTKTFNLPVVWNIFSVSLSSYPYGSLRKGIDYTWTPTSITFTSTIDETTQLANGQQCILSVVSG